MKRPIAIIVALFASGCVTNDPPSPPHKDYSKMTKCEQVANFLSNPWGTPAQQAVAMEVGRNNGCFGTSPEQRLHVTIDQQ